MDWKTYAPFTDVSGFIRLAIGVAIILLVLKLTGLKRYVA